MISRPQKDSKSIGLIEANTILFIRSFRNGIVSGGLVAVGVFITAFRMPSFWETLRLSEKSQFYVI